MVICRQSSSASEESEGQGSSDSSVGSEEDARAAERAHKKAKRKVGIYVFPLLVGFTPRAMQLQKGTCYAARATNATLLESTECV